MDTKKLRQKILDLAIRGKLVPQDPNDEPASVLLERIRAEKERLIQEGKIKRSKKSDSDDEIEAPFEIPESWEWCLLPDLCSIPITDGTHQTPTYTDKEHGIPFISSKDVTSQKINWNNIKFITRDLHESLYKRIAPQRDDILLAKNGTTGVAALVEDDFIFDIYVTLAVIRPIKDLVLPIFLWRVINSSFCKKQFDNHLTGIGLPNLHLTDIKKTIIPLPPLVEQKRISNEVERWFTLIDELESNEGDLLKAIDKAKSKILDLAIHGKLVPQDPNDEPAIDLLKRINPKFEACDNESDTYKLPGSWSWSILKNVCSDFIVPQRDKPTRFDGNIPWCRIEDIEGKYLNGSLSNQNVSMDLIKEMNMRICPIGTVLCSCSASLGIQAITTVPCCTNQTFIGIVPNKDIIYKDYLFYFLKSLSKLFYELGTGTTIKYISRTKFEELYIPLPPYQEQLHIVAKIEELFAVLDSIKESLEA